MKNIIKTSIVILSVFFCNVIVADEIKNTNSTTVTNTSNTPMGDNANLSTETSTTSTTTTVTNMDDKIVTAIYAKYAKDSTLIGTNLSVKSVNGIVTIYGTVVSQSQADEAVIAAKSISGVKDARSAINVTTNPSVNKSAPPANY